MATIAIKQPNKLFCIFSTVSCLPIECNLTEKAFVEKYLELYGDCTYRTRDQILADALDTCRNHAHPWEDFYEYCIAPPFYHLDGNDESEYFEEIEELCSKPIYKEEAYES